MHFDRRGAALVLAAIGVVVGLCALLWRCGAKPAEPAAAETLDAERKEQRLQEAETLAHAARDLRVLAQRYLAQGEKRKAHRAIGAAQELDRKIRALVEEK